MGMKTGGKNYQIITLKKYHITPATEVYDRREEFENCGVWTLFLTVLQCLKGKNDKLKSQILD